VPWLHNSQIIGAREPGVISGAVVAFTVVVGVIARDRLPPFARAVADGTYRVAQLLKNESQP